MLSVFADCHRCLNNSMSSKNLNDRQWMYINEERAPASHVDRIHTKYCTLRDEYHPVDGRQRTVHGGNEGRKTYM